MLEDWDDAFAGHEPVAHRLRSAFADRWVRFHSLPHAKRYPSDESEYAIVFDRFNQVVAELLQPGMPFVLLVTHWSNTAEAVAPDDPLSALAHGGDG